MFHHPRHGLPTKSPSLRPSGFSYKLRNKGSHRNFSGKSASSVQKRVSERPDNQPREWTEPPQGSARNTRAEDARRGPRDRQNDDGSRNTDREEPPTSPDRPMTKGDRKHTALPGERKAPTKAQHKSLHQATRKRPPRHQNGTLQSATHKSHHQATRKPPPIHRNLTPYSLHCGVVRHFWVSTETQICPCAPAGLSVQPPL